MLVLLKPRFKALTIAKNVGVLTVENFKVITVWLVPHDTPIKMIYLVLKYAAHESFQRDSGRLDDATFLVEDERVALVVHICSDCFQSLFEAVKIHLDVLRTLNKQDLLVL